MNTILTHLHHHGCLSVLRPSFVILMLICAKVAVADDKASSSLPGGTPEDANLAINDPDEYAWKLFLALSRQAHPDKPGEFDPSKPITKYDPDMDVVWESWALASGGRNGGPLINPEQLPKEAHPNYSEVFLSDGVKPLEWGTWKRTAAVKRFERLPAQQLDALRQTFHIEALRSPSELKNVPPAFVAISEQAQGDEVRMNRATYDFVRDNALYNVEGLEAQFEAETNRETSKEPLSFPVESQEIKAQWRKISEADKPRYHWRTLIEPKGDKVIYGLVALHIITKDLPNWFWSDFVHVDFDGASEIPAVDSTNTNADGSHVGTEGSKWSQYRLRGTQVDFTDPRGRYTLVANPLIEKGFQQTSSCITCHARATVGLRGSDSPTRFKRLSTFPISSAAPPTIVGAVGSPDPRWFVDLNGTPQYVQTDFLWSLPFRVLKTK